MNMESDKLFCLLWSLFLVFAGCAGPLDTATEQALVANFSGEVYQAKVYLGNHHYLPYTNNSVDGRNRVGIFIDRSLEYHYQTDAGFFESGSSGYGRSLKRLQEIDRDIDFGHFAQGIKAGQLVKITKFLDKSDQLILYIETLGRYDASKDYWSTVGSNSKPRESRIHCVLGKEGMHTFDWATLEQMLDQLLLEVPPLISEIQKREFILANYPATPLPDLIQFTGLSRFDILDMYYAGHFSENPLPSQARQKLVRMLLESPKRRQYEIFGIKPRSFEMGENFLKLNYDIQEVSNSHLYYGPEQRAALLFFDVVIPLAKYLQISLLGTNELVFFDMLLVTYSYPYFDLNGKRFDEEVTVSIPMEAFQQFLAESLSEQELANRSLILMGNTPLKVNFKAHEEIDHPLFRETASWKHVDVEIDEYYYEDDESGENWIITGKIVNTGNWIARDVTVTAKGYSGFNIFAKRKESETFDELLKPGETKEFTITLKKEELDRYKLSVEWEAVE